MTRARAEYEAMVGGVLSQVYRREGEFLTVDPADLDTPLTAVLEAEDCGSTRVDPDWLPVELAEMKELPREELLGVILRLVERQQRERQHMQAVFLDFLFAKGPDPRAVLERLFMYVRARSRYHVWGAKQNEIAALFGHLKQNWQHLEEAFIEDLVSRWSRAEFINSGGKNAAARLAYGAQRKGNTSRKRGRKAGDELPPLPAKQRDDEPLSSQAKRRARAMRDQAERQRLAAMCGCELDEIDLGRITPTDD